MVRIDLPELGEGQYVEIRDPKYLKWKEQKEITKSIKEGDLGSELDASEKLVMMIVKNGYVLDENNKPIQFPLDENSVQELPSIVVEKVVQKFAELKGVDQKN